MFEAAKASYPHNADIVLLGYRQNEFCRPGGRKVILKVNVRNPLRGDIDLVGRNAERGNGVRFVGRTDIQCAHTHQKGAFIGERTQVQPCDGKPHRSCNQP